ncbi:MAG: hypothetical protein KF814_09650 [Nitrospiraceae bacterium]|nr:hypothetical protein [Nitrospiraceae bacterium]
MQGGLAAVVGSFPHRTSELAEYPGLKVAVVRLLTIALHISGEQGVGVREVAMPLPTGYRAWPSYSALVQSAAGCRRIHCYVSSKALCTGDDRAFPVGTSFVVETYAYDGPGRAKVPASGNATGPEFIFVMGKYASMSSEDDRAERWQTWMYASYGQDGLPLAAAASSCGFCRLS